MNPWILLDQISVPGDGGLMKLYQRAHEFSISIKNEELMNSRMHGSEDSLAQLACTRVANRQKPRVLIGGLGMGFTLRAALTHLGADAEVVVVELVPAVIQWNRTHLAELAGHPLDDPRVTVRESDVRLVIKSDKDTVGLTHAGNDRLYTHGGLAAAKAALKPDGILAVWSAEPDKSFSKRLRGSGFKMEEISVRARGNRGGRRHTIWLAQK
jgi:spermidine synthase